MAKVLRSAITETDSGRTNTLRQTVALFHKNHFSRWAADYGQQLVQASETAYFTACGQLTTYLSKAFEIPEE